MEEAAEIGFVPGHEEPIIGMTVDALINAIRNWQIASMVIEEDGEARTINLCKLCYNAKLVQQSKQPLKSKEWKEVSEKKAHRSKLRKVFGSEQRHEILPLEDQVRPRANVNQLLQP